ncbi:uncharacterized protein LOC143962521 [Lithobates pipiens]
MDFPGGNHGQFKTSRRDQLCEDKIYANTFDLDVWRMRNTPTAKEIPTTQSTKYRVILILGVLLMLAFLVVVILISLLFTYYKSAQKEILQLKNDKNIEEEITQLKANYKNIEEEITQLKANDKNIEEEITQLKANYSALKKDVSDLQKSDSALKMDVSDLQKSVANITDGPNKINLIKNKGSSNTLCSEGWSHYGLSCYYLSSDSIPWIDSKKECENKGAHLVVVNGEEEMPHPGKRLSSLQDNNLSTGRLRDYD